MRVTTPRQVTLSPNITLEFVTATDFKVTLVSNGIQGQYTQRFHPAPSELVEIDIIIVTGRNQFRARVRVLPTDLFGVLCNQHLCGAGHVPSS
jgi:hypothetical protein